MSTERRGITKPRETTTLADLLDRVLDKGLVVAGDVSISLANVELLTLQIRLLVCSIDKAEQIGLNWWKYDRNLSSSGKTFENENKELRERVFQLEREMKALAAAASPSSGKSGRSKSKA